MPHTLSARPRAATKRMGPYRRPCTSSDWLGMRETWLCTASQRPPRRSSTNVARPGRRKARPSGAVASEDQPVAIHAASPLAPTVAPGSSVNPRMRGQIWRHCSRSMLSSPATAAAKVPKATASGANRRRPASKSFARTAAWNSVIHAAMSDGVVGMARIIAVARTLSIAGPAAILLAMDPEPLTLDTLRALARARGLDLSDAELAGLLPLVESGRAMIATLDSALTRETEPTSHFRVL